MKWDKLNSRETQKYSASLLFSDISALKQGVSMFLFSSDKGKKMIQKLQIISPSFSSARFILGALPWHLVPLLPKQWLQLPWFHLLLEQQELGVAIYFFIAADVLGIQLCHHCRLDPVLWLKKKRPGSFHPQDRQKLRG